MSADLEISLQTARQLAVRKQLLDRSFQVSAAQATKADILQVFEALRCIQIDPIRAVERTELLVLWSRLGPFRPQDLHDLTFVDKYLCEDWAHCASLGLMADWPLYCHAKSLYRASHDAYATRMRTWIQQNQALLQHIRQAMAAKGPLSTRDFAQDIPHVPWTSRGWSNGRSVSRILDHLFARGEVMVAGRSRNRKYWALTEHFLPAHADTTALGDREMSWQGLQLSLRALGVGTPRHMYNHFIRKAYPQWQTVLRDLVAAGLHVPVGIRTAAGHRLPGDWFLHRDDVELAVSGDLDSAQGRTVLLSPFDNLICDRQRTAQLFDFTYTVEIYVPPAKRQYGYYVLPILRHERFVGRIDMRMKRPERQLQVQALYPEAPWRIHTESAAELAANIQDLASFLGAQTVQLGRRMPVVWRQALRAYC